MITSNTVNLAIDKRLLEKNTNRTKLHKPSGKLSASILGAPLQWQILKKLGAPRAPFDAYTLRKFLRGTTIEDWLLDMTPGLMESQMFVEYRNVVGYVDGVVDHSDYDFKGNLIPHEIKSVTNMKFKYITKGGPDDNHCLQGALYAIAMGTDNFVIDYVASDDLRLLSFVLKTSDYKERIDNIIDKYDEQIGKREVPVFTPTYAWQKNKDYNNYPDWSELSEKEIAEKVERMGLLDNWG